MNQPAPTVTIVKHRPPADVNTRAARKAELLARLTDNVLLPRPPGIVLQVLEKASKPNCSIGDLAAIVHRDAVLCARLLQTVNSALFQLRSPVASVNQAMALLGLRQIRSLVLGLSLPAIHQQCKPNAWMKEFWKYSITVTIVAHELALLRRCPSPSDDLVAGLLCDLGTIILQQLYPDDYTRLVAHSSELLARKQCELEEELLGINHAELGAHLLKSWRLPPEITDPVLWHHHPEFASDERPELTERTYLLHFATQLANIQSGGLSRSLRQSIFDLASSRFGLDEQALLSFLAPLNKKVVEFATLLKVEIGAFSNYTELFANATQELVRLTIESSTDALKSQHNTPANTLWRMLKKADTGAHPLPRETSSRVAEDHSVPIEDLCLEAPIQLGHYTISKVLGRGGMGVVFRAFDEFLRRDVAIKVLGPWLASHTQARLRFAREGQVAASVKHPNVVTVYSVEETDELSYLVMEFVDGLSLAKRLDEHPRPTIKEILQIGVQLAEGLASAHVQNLIHRDIKPENILLLNNPLQVKITDFGLARALDDTSMTQEGVLVGTPEYMAPEQVRGHTLDFRTDLFSLGGVLFTMCAGMPPFGDDQTFRVLRRITDEDFPSIRELNPTIPNDLIATIERLLSKTPSERFQSAGELATLLRRQLVSLLRSGSQ